MIAERLNTILSELPQSVKLVAVSKFHPLSAIREAYDAGQRVFGESRPQEFAAKVPLLPADIEWHFIGHLQTNKLKLVLPYASLVESVDSVHLLEAISRWAVSEGRTVDVLLELHLGSEKTKSGLSEEEILSICGAPLEGICLRGLMGMATNTDDKAVIRSEFERIAALKRLINTGFPSLESFSELSIGMSDDWPLAVEAGSTAVRIGTAIFGPREY
ncbi:MAG: YggS family pyridoxal phosphate-dependent enzyme [Bacteroidales bacterium]|nr:YggS family pyridoxal phosphate-dependent enzyme [Bacteroidales bacterium]